MSENVPRPGRVVRRVRHSQLAREGVSFEDTHAGLQTSMDRRVQLVPVLLIERRYNFFVWGTDRQSRPKVPILQALYPRTYLLSMGALH